MKTASGIQKAELNSAWRVRTGRRTVADRRAVGSEAGCHEGLANTAHVLAHGGSSSGACLADRYRAEAAAEKALPEKWVFVRTDGSGRPLCDSGVRQALKRA